MDRLKILPVIDVSNIASRRDEIAGEIRDAMELSGFFQIWGHSIPRGVIDGVRAAARGFFAEPLEVKSAIAINQVNRGYLAEGMARMRGAVRTDRKEVFFWRRELSEDAPEVRAGLPLCGPNQWPETPPGFHDAVTAYHREIEKLGNALLRAIAVSLGAEPDFFEPHYRRSMTRGQLIHYPAQTGRVEPDSFGAAPHTDFGSITLLLQESAGLSVKTLNGNWLPVPPHEGTLVVNIGDLMERWTNGRYPSTVHRVRNRTGAGRYSIAMFHDPDPHAVIDPADLDAGGVPRFAPMSAAEHILARNREAFAHYKNR